MGLVDLLIPETTGGVLVMVMTVFGGVLLSYLMFQQPQEEPPACDEVIEPPEPPRNFTAEQLLEFNGADDATSAYVALRGEVFDVSSKPEHYKKGGSYNLFAGHDASYCLATGSLNPADLDKSWSDLSPMEKDSLDGWVEKYKHYNAYPVVGKVVPTPELKEYTLEELLQFDGTTPVSEDRAAAPILVGIKGKVYDMSFGGVSMYGPEKSYNIFAGRDASVALAKMSFNSEHLEKPDASTLTTQEREVLDDWEKKLSSKYPVVGTIASAAAS